VKKEIGMQRLLSELRKRRNNQKGFTLIEMLVVISILGILAAVVTLSMVGITSTAKTHALQAERQTIQVAMDTMAAENQVATGASCPNTDPKAAVANMDVFPPGPGVNPGTTTPPAGVPIALYPRYIHTKAALQQTYYCDGDGVVHGVSVDH
jgi:prepilin-type N-terminal cleavage/methylation domain-containing protein